MDEHEQSQEERPRTVEVNADALDNLVKTVEDLKAKNQELTDMVMSTADVGRLSRFQSLRSKPMPKQVRLSKYNGKIVTGWKLTANEVYQVQGIWHEKQEMDVYYADGTKDTGVSYKNFSLQKEMIEAEILSSTKDQSGNETLSVQITGTDQKLEIGASYVN